MDATKSIITLKPKDKTAPNLLIGNKNVITNKNYIAEIFNDIFVNVGSIMYLNYLKEKDLLIYI